MKTVSVKASGSYEVTVGFGVLSRLGETVKALGGAEKICIVSETTVWPLWGGAAEESLRNAGFSPVSYVFPAGEASKNGETFLALLNVLAEQRLSRSDLIVALGGGVTGDLTGFAAACYMRGIRFIQVPTTVLAMVDSSVGGKTAVDLPAGKNLAGAFWQPSAVLCDLDCLTTLPREIFLEGCAEIIKTAILFDPELMELLERDGPDFDRETVIARCIAHKRDVVEQDEREQGLRQKLNLGHTLGHAVEALSRYTLSHGASVSVGTAMVVRSGAALGYCPQALADRCVKLLQAFELPTQTQESPQALAEKALSDKKRRGDFLNLIIPREIGRCDICPIPVSRLQSFIEAGL